jgi:hypothetical protein
LCDPTPLPVSVCALVVLTTAPVATWSSSNSPSALPPSRGGRRSARALRWRCIASRIWQPLFRRDRRMQKGGQSTSAATHKRLVPPITHQTLFASAGARGTAWPSRTCQRRSTTNTARVAPTGRWCARVQTVSATGAASSDPIQHRRYTSQSLPSCFHIFTTRHLRMPTRILPRLVRTLVRQRTGRAVRAVRSAMEVARGSVRRSPEFCITQTCSTMAGGHSSRETPRQIRQVPGTTLLLLQQQQTGCQGTYLPAAVGAKVKMACAGGRRAIEI